VRVVRALREHERRAESSDALSVGLTLRSWRPFVACLCARRLDGWGFPEQLSSGRWPEYPRNRPSDFREKRVTLAPYRREGQSA
jgi:hypothetical protein